MAEIQPAPNLTSVNPAMDNERAVTYLDSLLGRTLRVHTSDTRIFVGEFKCTDRVSYTGRSLRQEVGSGISGEPGADAYHLVAARIETSFLA